jgi:probable HAF family extracellular repeat protein
MRMLRTCIAASIALCATGALAATFPAPPLYPSFSSAKAQFITIDAPGAVSTIAVAVNDKDKVAGYYVDKNNLWHGFIRKADGTFLTFDASAGLSTSVSGMNAGGEVTGYYGNFGGANDAHGYVRKADGTITEFDVPNSKATYPYAINNNGEIVGFFNDGNGGGHGFLRSPAGTIIVLDYPGGTFTIPKAINSAGIIVGDTCIGSPCHAFMRDAQGNFTLIDPPGATDVSATAINASGTIIGICKDKAWRNFIRDPSGTFTLLKGRYTTLTGINNAGVTAGYRLDGYAFIRSAAGDTTGFRASGAYRTYTSGINAHRSIVGYYSTGPGAEAAGFLRTQ